MFAWAAVGRSSARSPAPRNYPPLGTQRAFTLPNAARHYHSVSPRTFQFTYRWSQVKFKISVKKERKKKKHKEREAENLFLLSLQCGSVLRANFIGLRFVFQRIETGEKRTRLLKSSRRVIKIEKKHDSLTCLHGRNAFCSLKLIWRSVRWSYFTYTHRCWLLRIYILNIIYFIYNYITYIYIYIYLFSLLRITLHSIKREINACALWTSDIRSTILPWGCVINRSTNENSNNEDIFTR